MIICNNYFERKKCQKCNGNYEIKDSKYVKLPNILILKI
jgi:hypothetical protein